jgi:hypothetical protein
MFRAMPGKPLMVRMNIINQVMVFSRSPEVYREVRRCC